jgi:hypothetical protein
LNVETCQGAINLLGVANRLRYLFNPLAHFERERIKFGVGRAGDRRNLGVGKLKFGIVAGDAEVAGLSL